VINAGTAKTLGLIVPAVCCSARADEVDRVIRLPHRETANTGRGKAKFRRGRLTAYPRLTRRSQCSCGIFALRVALANLG